MDRLVAFYPNGASFGHGRPHNLQASLILWSYLQWQMLPALLIANKNSRPTRIFTSSWTDVSKQDGGFLRRTTPGVTSIEVTENHSVTCTSYIWMLFKFQGGWLESLV